ncbi:hypothetical protein ACFVXQ_11840, partial [Kitasatospora sp. NPDC058263]
PAGGPSGGTSAGTGTNTACRTCKRPKAPPRPTAVTVEPPKRLWDPTKAIVERPVPQPDWMPPKPEDALKWLSASYSTADLLAMLMTTQNVSPTSESEVYPVPGPESQPGGKNGWRRKDADCDEGPGISATGHAVYLPREKYFDSFSGRNECRATGTWFALDGSDYNPSADPLKGTQTTSKIRPPGYEEIRSYGEDPANGHMLPSAASGAGADLRNLVAEYRLTNSPYLRDGAEADIRNSIINQRHVIGQIVPHYRSDDSGIYDSKEYNYTVVEEGRTVHCIVYQSPMGGKTNGGCPNMKYKVKYV